MNLILPVALWSGLFWRWQADSLALWVRVGQAQRNGDEIANRKHSEAAWAAERKIAALVAALASFCERTGVDLAAARAAAGVPFDYKPLASPDPAYQAVTEEYLTKISQTGARR